MVDGRNVRESQRAQHIAVVEIADEVISWAEAGASGYIPRTTGIADFVPLLIDISLSGERSSWLAAPDFQWWRSE